MGRRAYPPEFRRRVIDLVETGRRIAEVADDLGISDQTIYSWRRQDRIDRGLEAGMSSAEQAELERRQRHDRCWAKHQTITDPVHEHAGKVMRAFELAATDDDDHVEIRDLSVYDHLGETAS